jgi:hypothetical protein
MSTRCYHGDCCPACGSHQVIPYAVLIGAAKSTATNASPCEVMWPVLTYPAEKVAAPAGRRRSPAA